MWSSAPGCDQPPLTCPFCGLACDDLRPDQELAAPVNACDLARRQLEAILAQPAETPRIQGRPADLHTALARCVEHLAEAHSPLFAGLATDVNGMRTTLALADRCGAVVDHKGSDALFRNVLTLQDSGWLTTTLTEARNRADLVLILGTECHRRFPRLVERVLAPREALFVEADAREYVLLGPWDGEATPEGLPEHRTTRIEARRSDLGRIAGLLRALVAGRPVRADRAPGVDGARLTALAERLSRARYALVVWSAAELSMPHAELIVQGWAELVRDLNETTRAAALPLGGSQGDVTTNQVCTWQSGYPLRTGFQGGGPSYDPLMNSHLGLLARGESDLLLWIDALSSDGPPPAPDCPTLVLGRADMAFEQTPDVFIPVGVPGIDHPGHWYRTDAVCPLPLGKIRESELPSVAQVVNLLLEGLRTTP